METRHFQTGPTGFADRTVSRPVVRISANAAMRIDASLSLSLFLFLPCNRTFRLSGYHLFTRDSIQSRCYFTRGRNRAKGRAHSPTRSPGEIGVANEKKKSGGGRKEEEENIYTYTRTQSIVQFWLKLATWPSRTVTKRALSPFVATFDCDVVRLSHCRGNKVTMLMISGLL